MSDESKFILGVVAVVLAIAGLVVAAWAVHGPWYWVGLGVFIAGVLAVFLVIRLVTRHPPESPEGEAPPGQ